MEIPVSVIAWTLFVQRLHSILYIPTDTEPAPVTVQERLMISKIVNYNFKSYAGTQVLGPFHKVYLGEMAVLLSC